MRGHRLILVRNAQGWNMTVDGYPLHLQHGNILLLRREPDGMHLEQLGGGAEGMPALASLVPPHLAPQLIPQATLLAQANADSLLVASWLDRIRPQPVSPSHAP